MENFHISNLNPPQALTTDKEKDKTKLATICKIELKEITVRELTNGYADNGDAGVTGHSGKLDIRPPYQREFIYLSRKRP